MEKDEGKYVSGLSTILVATIEEAKERISQIEYIFCTQLYPNIHSRSMTSEDAWKSKETDLLLRIEKLELEKQEAIAQNRSLTLEKEKWFSDREEQANSLAATVRTQQIRIEHLEAKLMEKSKEVDEGMELQSTLLQLIQTKSNFIAEKEKQLKESEEKASGLVTRVSSLEKEVQELLAELREKSENQNDMEKSVRRRVDALLSTAEANHEKEKKELAFKLECLEQNVSELQDKLDKKTRESEKGQEMQAKLLQQIEASDMETVKQKQKLESSEDEKRRLFDKVNSLEESINELQENLSGRSEGEGKASYEKLYQKLLAETKKNKVAVDAYKRLKSKYNYLLSQSGLIIENKVPREKYEDQIGLQKQQEDPTNSLDFEDKHLDSFQADCEMDKIKSENEFSGSLENDEVAKSIPPSCFQPPASGYIAPKRPSSAISGPVVGKKRLASSWINTRSHHRKDGPDPHDDFLDTPLEKLRGNLNKTIKEELVDHDVPCQKDMNPSNLDDETQDMNANPCPQEQQIPQQVAGQRSFKYIEPVRKKAERENLKGVECKQCKKFYDAVLPSDGGKYANGDKQNFRCEHLDGVSRHRYKYIPPSTPEGFWNIGFESEM
ncbi:hypothetical protein Tsubulata_006183 [Turnera subulata]|uniref:DNA endonuclease activator Ctp1 C-terminal domain-containing protein n=1 Tax=Turnera subulata TaxID=218843 RepID=A0A9Q0J557_9ROSI|nr:hypothetical protein Tsubulata_006183 [Turnera subulata]